MKAEELRALIAQATDSDLADGGRYFAETCHDLTRCRHGEIGEYQDGSDGDLIEWLWNNRRRILELAEACAGIEDDFMSSEKHHPDYVLIPTERFVAISVAARPKARP